MEIFWKRRPKIPSSSAGQSFSDFTASSAFVSFRGDKHIQKQRKFLVSTFDSSSYSNDTTEEDRLMFELDRRSSKLSAGTPMKKLLEQEMLKKNESRRRTPGIIARLMGLDGLPPQQSSHKQRKRTESGQVRVQKGGTFYSRRSSRKSSKQVQEFKDVFEVLDASKVKTGGNSAQGTANSKLSDVELAFMQQKFTEAKVLSTDEKLKDSDEFSDTLEVLDSNMDILLEFLQKPDSSFTKHLGDLQGVPPQSRCGRISAMKSSRMLKDRDDYLGQKAGRENQLKQHSKSPQQHQEDMLSQSYRRYAAHNRLKVPKVQLEENNGPAIIPTRIAVLKPNLGKSQNSTRTASSSCSSHHFPSGCAGHSGNLDIQKEEVELWSVKTVHQDIGFSRHNSKESRKIAKEITRQMKNSFRGSIKVSSSRFRGYSGDVNSCDVSASESAKDSDGTTVSYSDKIGWNKQPRRSSSHSCESTLSWEAKKRLSDRWKLTHRPQEVDLISMCSTLGEMLAISDTEVSPANSSGGFAEEGCSKFIHVGQAVWDEPLGISCGDGWKDRCLSNLSNSARLRINTSHESLCGEEYGFQKDGSKRGRDKAVKGNFNQREAPLPSNQRFSVKKSQFPISSCSSNEENSDFSPDLHFTPYQVKQNSEWDTQSKDSLKVSGASARTAMDSSSVLENKVDAYDQNKVVLSGPSHMELSAPDSPNAVVSSGDEDNLDSQELSKEPSKQATLCCPVPERESQAICKEADQPSPVSVIEAPFTEDFTSGFECFESLSADLHGLRMQLQLLKQESEAHEELSSEDDADEVSIEFFKDNGISRVEEEWESMYMNDVLVDSGINGVDPDTFMATCQWLDLREDIGVICREIERLLVDELEAEVVAG